MARPVEWRYPNPFRVTPPFGGVGHWEGSGYHWEQSGSGYIQIAGDEWYQFIITVDEGYDEDRSYYDPDYRVEKGGYLVDPDEWDSSDIGDSAFFDGFEWFIFDKYTKMTPVGQGYFLSYYRMADGAYHQLIIHHTILIDYWNAWKYENLQWQLVESAIRRNHV